MHACLRTRTAGPDWQRRANDVAYEWGDEARHYVILRILCIPFCQIVAGRVHYTWSRAVGAACRKKKGMPPVHAALESRQTLSINTG